MHRSTRVGIGNAASEIGSGLGQIGGGIQSTLTGIGTGTAQLLNPLFSGLDLLGRAREVLGFAPAGDVRERSTETRQTPARTSSLRPLPSSHPASRLAAVPGGADLFRESLDVYLDTPGFFTPEIRDYYLRLPAGTITAGQRERLREVITS